MPLLRNGEFIEDTFLTLEDDAPLPAAGNVVVSWKRLEKEFDGLKARAGALGVLFPVDAEPEALTPYLAALSLIVLPFAKFGDGRGYSIARILRSRLGYAGELRAAGDVLPDQIAFMRQLGFESFAPNSERYTPEAWLAAATRMSLSYQSGFLPAHGYSPADIFELRRQRR